MNLFDCTAPDEGEDFTTLLEQHNIKIVRIVSSGNITSQTYIQEEDEWVVVLEGEARLQIGNKEKILAKGDTLFIPAKTPHKVLQTKHSTLWLAVHIH